MDEYIKRAIDLYVDNQITRAELSALIAKEYAKLVARGRILGLLGLTEGTDVA